MTERERGAKVHLPERMASRWERYLRGVQDLTLEGSVEPRRWIGCAEGFWLGVAQDTADWLRYSGYGDRPAPAASIAETRRVPLPASGTGTEVEFAIDEEVFRLLGSERLELRASPLQCNEVTVAVPQRNLRVEPKLVSIEDPVAKLRIFDLTRLTTGMRLDGVVWADVAGAASRSNPPLVVASIVVDVT